MGVTHCGDNRLPPAGMDGTFDKAGLATAAERDRRAGFDLLEISRLDPYAFDIAAARSVLAEGSLEVAASLGVPEHAWSEPVGAQSVQHCRGRARLPRRAGQSTDQAACGHLPHEHRGERLLLPGAGRR
jgi:hypothetical protein